MENLKIHFGKGNTNKEVIVHTLPELYWHHSEEHKFLQPYISNSIFKYFIQNKKALNIIQQYHEASRKAFFELGPDCERKLFSGPVVHPRNRLNTAKRSCDIEIYHILPDSLLELKDPQYIDSELEHQLSKEGIDYSYASNVQNKDGFIAMANTWKETLLSEIRVKFFLLDQKSLDQYLKNDIYLTT